MAGPLVKGALVELSVSLPSTPPNVIIFQLNPETIRHTWTQPEPASWEPGANPFAVRGMPGESFSFSISLDATDEIAAGGLAVTQGLYARLAALELLLFPTRAGGSDAALVSSPPSTGTTGTSSPGSGDQSVPAWQMPAVLFVWGPNRILPVRITSLTVTEKLYDASLNPTHAEAEIELRVLTSDELGVLTDAASVIANAAYNSAKTRRAALTMANLGDAAQSVIGMIPPSILPT